MAEISTVLEPKSIHFESTTMSHPLRLMALETSGLAGSVAALEDDELLLELDLDPARRTAQALVPTMEEVLRQVGWRPGSVDLVAVTSGPGSFTGLRIGVTTAKTLAYATGAALVGVHTLAVLARGVNVGNSPPEAPVWVVMNAERGQLFAASFRYRESEWLEVEKTCIVDEQALLDRVPGGAIVTGPGLTAIKARIPPGVQVVPESQWTPRAQDVGREGWRAFRAGLQSQWWSLVPNYYRECAAVEKVHRGLSDPSPSLPK
jgi:tRNA threonylcarbamoyladenosine biosynthesis protein TsaB